MTWDVAMRSKCKALDKSAVGEQMEKLEYASQFRAKVEHPFYMVKNLIRHRKAHYKGLAKNTAQLSMLCGGLFSVFLDPNGQIYQIKLNNL